MLPERRYGRTNELAARAEAEKVVVAISGGAVSEALLLEVFTPFFPVRTELPSGGLARAKCHQAALVHHCA